MHFKLMIYLHHNILVNVPNYFNHMLTRMAIEYRNKRKLYSLSHHCLVIILVKRSLFSQFLNIRWGEFKEGQHSTLALKECSRKCR